MRNAITVISLTTKIDTGMFNPDADAPPVWLVFGKEGS
jgi:hypothetical protein